MGCHDQQRPHRLRRFSPLLTARIAAGLRPVAFILREPASPPGEEAPAPSWTLT